MSTTRDEVTVPVCAATEVKLVSVSSMGASSQEAERTQNQMADAFVIWLYQHVPTPFWNRLMQRMVELNTIADRGCTATDDYIRNLRRAS